MVFELGSKLKFDQLHLFDRFLSLNVLLVMLDRGVLRFEYVGMVWFGVKLGLWKYSDLVLGN